MNFIGKFETFFPVKLVLLAFLGGNLISCENFPAVIGFKTVVFWMMNLEIRFNFKIGCLNFIED